MSNENQVPALCDEARAESAAPTSEPATSEPAAEPFVVGDVVRLKSGGSLMTVENVSGDFCSCAWFQPQESGWGGFSTGHVLRRDRFPLATLVRR